MTQSVGYLLKAPYRLARNALTDVFFERRYGVRTASEVSLAELGIVHHERSDYKAAGWLILRRILPLCEVGPADVFIDLGAGMGRVVLQAARRYPFQQVIGVELSSQLVEIARQNLANNTARLRCPNVSLVHADALDYEIPDDVTVVFLYNPFKGSIFTEVVNNLIESVDRRPRVVRLIYVNPVEESRLLGTGRVRVVRSLRGMRPTAAWSRSNSTRMYVIEPRASVERPGMGIDQQGRRKLWRRKSDLGFARTLGS